MPISMETFANALEEYAIPQAFRAVVEVTGIDPPPWNDLFEMQGVGTLELEELRPDLVERAFKHRPAVRVIYSPVLFPRVDRLERAVVRFGERVEEWRDWWSRRP